jgi:hypothetical protein
VSSGELPKRMGRGVIIRVYDALGGHGKGIIETTWSFSKFSRRIFWRMMGRKFLSRVGGSRWTWVLSKWPPTALFYLEYVLCIAGLKWYI